MKKNKNKGWRRLDNAAKIFPPTSSNRDPKVFRFSCELYDTVNKDCLQHALNLTLKRFPFYRSILKQGMFWYYFEESRLIPAVTEENTPPCSPIYDANSKELLFRVTYFKKRINFEVFHALSDGVGAVQFLKALVVNYLNLAHKNMEEPIRLEDYDASVSQMTLDGFSKYFSEVKVRRIKAPKAFRFKGKRYPNYRIGVIECVIPLNKVKEKTKEKKVTITEYLVALLISAIGENMSVRDKKRPISVSIPVNLRAFFPTKTSQNFFSVVNLTHDFHTQGTTVSDILENVSHFFKENLKQEHLLNRINLFASLENKLPVQLLPLFIKIPSLKIANKISDQAVTAAFSNVGQIILPDEANKYVRRFSVFTSTAKIQVTMCTFKNDMVITFTSPFINTDIQCSFLDRINEIEGMEIEVNTNIGTI